MNPSINILTQKLSIEVSNIDVILMPIFSELTDNDESLNSDNGGSEEDKERDNEPPAKAKSAPSQTEEYNVIFQFNSQILNNLVNKVLSNLEVKLTHLALRVLTNEIKLSSQDIPTILVRVSEVAYSRSEDEGVLPSKLKDVNPTESDLQVILDGKKLEVKEISVHLIEHFKLYPEQIHKMNPNLSQLQFPFQYPVVHDPSTLLLVKPIVFNQNKENQEDSYKGGFALQVLLKFQKRQQIKAKAKTYLSLSVSLPNIESILDFSQLSQLFSFTQRIESYHSKLKIQKLAPSLDPSDNSASSLHQSSKSKEDIIDLYGTFIRTNSVNFKEFKMNKGEGVVTHSLNQSVSKQKEQEAFNKEKLINKFLMKGGRKEISELTKSMQIGMKRENMVEKIEGGKQEKGVNRFGHAITKNDPSALLLSQELIYSFAAVSDESDDLSLDINLTISKISLNLQCSERKKLLNQQVLHSTHDRIYDSLFHLIEPQLAPQIQVIKREGESRVEIDCGKYPGERKEHRMGDTYYSLEIRNAKLGVNQSKHLVEDKVASKNPFAKAVESKEVQSIKIHFRVAALSLQRYDLCQNPQLFEQHNKESIILQNSTGASCLVMENYMEESKLEESQTNSASFYESFYQNSEVFKSAAEFYNTDSNAHIQESSQQTKEKCSIYKDYCTLSKFLVSQLPSINPSTVHFCPQTIFEIAQISSHPDSIIDSKLLIEKDKKVSKVKCKTKLGHLRINMGWNETICSVFISQFKMPKTAPLTDLKEEKQAKNMEIELGEIEIEGVQVSLNHSMPNPEFIIEAILQNQAIQEVVKRDCHCNLRSHMLNNNELLTCLLLSNAKVQIKQGHQEILFKHLDIVLQLPQQQKDQKVIPFIKLSQVSIKVIPESSSPPAVSHQKYKVERAKIIYEDQEIEESNSSGSEEEVKESFSAQNKHKIKYSKVDIVKSKTLTSIIIEKVLIQMDLKRISLISNYALDLERDFKVRSVLADIARCVQGRNKAEQEELEKSKGYRKVNEESMVEEQERQSEDDLQESRGSGMQVDVEIKDLQIVVCDTGNREELLEQSVSPSLLLKLRLHSLHFFLTLQPQFTHQPSPIPNYYTLKESATFMKFKLQLEDLFLLDYTLPLSSFHPYYTKAQVPIFLEPKMFIATEPLEFYSELVHSKPFVILYKQSGLSEKYKNPRFLTLTDTIQIRNIFDFEEQLKLRDLQLLFKRTSKENKELQMYQDLDIIKRNPMKSELQITIQGLIGRLMLKSTLPDKFQSYNGQIKNILSQRRQPPLNHFKPMEQDILNLQLNIQDLTLDYTPQVFAVDYEKRFKPQQAERLKYKVGHDELFLSPIRCLVQLADSQLVIREQVKGGEEGVVSQVKMFVAKTFSVSVLNNAESGFWETMNPTLLVDYQYSLSSLSGSSLLDQLGFAQIFVVDHLDMSYEVDKRISTIPSADLPFPSPAASIYSSQPFHLGMHLDSAPDLFQTAYPVPAQPVPDSHILQERIQIRANKIILFLAKDSFKTAKDVIKILGQEVNKRKPKQKKKKSEKQKEQEQLIVHSFYTELPLVFEDFLLLELEKLEKAEGKEGDMLFSFNSDGEEEEDAMDEDEEAMFVLQAGEEDYLAGINEGGIHESRVKEFRLEDVLIDNHIPEFKEKDINEASHRDCHLHKQEEGERVKQKFYFEINTLDLRLYDGLDFDFDPSPPTHFPQTTSSLSFTQKPNPFNQMASSKHQPLFQIEEGYLEMEEGGKRNSEEGGLSNSSIRKSVSVKRKRLSVKAGSNYFQVLIKNPILSRHILDFVGVEDSKKERTKICISFKELQLKETLSREGTQKFLLHLPDQYKYDNQGQISVIIDEFSHCIEVECKIQLQTFKLMLNQASIAFFQKFFDLNFNMKKQKIDESQLYTSGASSQSKATSSAYDQQKPIYFRNLKIFPFRAILSYSSKSLNVKVLTEGNIIEILNIFNIHDLKILIKQYELKQRLKAEEVAKHLLMFYRKDIFGNQKISLIKAIGPIRSMANIVGAVYGVVNKPYQSYVNDRGVIQGFGQGIAGLYTVFSNETYALSQKVVEGITREGKS